MSRTFMFLTLGVLVVMLGVMAYLVGPKTPPQPSAEDTKKAQDAAAKQQEATLPPQKQGVRAPADNPHLRVMPIHPPRGVSPVGRVRKHVRTPGAMDISSDWWKHRTEGDQGLSQLDRESKKPMAPSPRKTNPAPAPTVSEKPVTPSPPQ